MAHLDGSVCRGYPEIARDARRLPVGRVDNRKEKRIVAQTCCVYPRAIACKGTERPVSQVGPVSPFGVSRERSEQGFHMAVRVEGFQPAQSALHRLARWDGRG